MKKFILSILILLSFYSFSIAQPTAQPQTVQPITEAQAIEIAKQEAIARGVKLDLFGGGVSTMFNDNQWIIHFRGKPNDDGVMTIGDDFMVFVSSEGEVLGFLPGH